ncbi:hypothetical protein FB45DRAFT_930860 [Roridomyces roridus]|uniref:Uncharacterized protein n=1 Tax=Roridomyces roridus TaxID=1738132 RepID=A0AAD7BFI0_9AGAR|nr:hypothetical protein FB45DRAFT_930860 [Roridomyces roridus]
MLKKATARVKIIHGACFAGAWHTLGLESKPNLELITALSEYGPLPTPSEYKARFLGSSSTECPLDEEEFDYGFFSDESDDELPSTEEEEEVESLDEVELAMLDAYGAIWERRTRPSGDLAHHSHRVTRSAIEQHREGRFNNKKTAALLRLFNARAAADEIAQELADEAGIAHPALPCTEFREVYALELLPCQGVVWDKVYWGTQLEPVDDREIDRLGRRYMKASQWLFWTWSRSKEPVSMLEKMLEQVGGRLHCDSECESE